MKTGSMPPVLRRSLLTVHVVTSVGWLGAVAAFLALAVTGLTGRDTATVRGAHVGAEILTDVVIVPLALASLVTGVLQSLGTPWGLLRHWWVVAKLALTVVSTALLLLHTQPIGHLGAAAATPAGVSDGLAGMQIQLVADAAAALLVLLGATVPAVVKPRGLTPFARRAL